MFIIIKTKLKYICTNIILKKFNIKVDYKFTMLLQLIKHVLIGFWFFVIAQDFKVIISSEFSVKQEQVKKLKLRVQEILREYVKFFELEHPVSGKVEINLVTDFSYHSRFKAPKWSNAFFINGRILIPKSTLQNGDLDKTLRHELSHLVLYENFGSNVPEWLDEGLALYLEGPQSELLRYFQSWKEAPTKISLKNISRGMTSLKFSDVGKAYAISYVAVASLLQKGHKDKILRILKNYKDEPNPRELASFIKLSEEQLKK